MLEPIREFKFGRPQQFAALLLLALIGLAARDSFSERGCDKFENCAGETTHLAYEAEASLVKGIDALQAGNYGKRFPSGYDSIAAIRVLQCFDWAAVNIYDRLHWAPSYLLFKSSRLIFTLTATWLAAALWWVTRRLYNDRGAYVALGLFCFSLPMITAGSRINADIIAAWGLYGLIYTAIGVAHTLYAPPQKWPPRVLLLGVALGVTAGAHFAAGIIGLALATIFMLHLAPGRRTASLAILAAATAVALVMLFALYGFDVHALELAFGAWNVWGFHFAWPSPKIHEMQSGVLLGLALAAALTLIAWRWTRYFGNLVPLLAAFVLFAVHTSNLADTTVWALPFVFTFIGGMFADMMESRRPELVKALLWVAMGAYAMLAALSVLVPAVAGPAGL